MKGHTSKKPMSNVIAVYVISEDGENSELKSIDGVIECITMLVYVEGSEKGYYGNGAEGKHYMTFKNKLLGFVTEWKFKGLLSLQLCQMIFNSEWMVKWHNKWGSQIFNHSETLKTKINYVDGK